MINTPTVDTTPIPTSTAYSTKKTTPIHPDEIQTTVTGDKTTLIEGKTTLQKNDKTTLITKEPSTKRPIESPQKASNSKKKIVPLVIFLCVLAVCIIILSIYLIIRSKKKEDQQPIDQAQ